MFTIASVPMPPCRKRLNSHVDHLLRLLRAACFVIQHATTGWWLNCSFSGSLAVSTIGCHFCSAAALPVCGRVTAAPRAQLWRIWRFHLRSGSVRCKEQSSALLLTVHGLLRSVLLLSSSIVALAADTLKAPPRVRTTAEIILLALGSTLFVPGRAPSGCQTKINVESAVGVFSVSKLLPQADHKRA